MTLSYRSRRILRRLLITALIMVLVVALGLAVWLLWLDRYVVYSRDGARLDFTLSNQSLTGQPARPPENDVTVSIFYNEGEDALNVSTEMAKLTGYYITGDMLISSISQVRTQVGNLPSGTPVLIDVKDIVGRFYYTSALGSTYSKIDPEAMNELISYMNSRGLYLIARTPAFRDYNYARAHTAYGLRAPGGYLWVDSSRCYWLSPGSDGALSFLMQIVSELKDLGFDEVVFSDFCFPDTKDIVFKGDKDATLVAAAEALVSACASDRFTVSFIVEKASFALPEGRCRMYLANRPAAEVKALAEQTGLENPDVRLVFLTEINDTRYDDYGALRPITSAG